MGGARGHNVLTRVEGSVVAPDAHQVSRRPILPDGGGGGDGGGLGGRARRALGAGLAALLRRDRVVLAGLLALAALLRFVGLETRGRFDGDQGHDALVLLRLVRDGIVPLLGPPTSIGDFHHGAAYYYLLTPAAWLSDAHPTAIVAWIAALGVAGVAATWWFARMVGGRVAAAIAGLLMAVSPASIEESTFIWNPNPIPLFAALALGSAWRAHSSGRGRWWILALVSAGMVVQLHVLGLVFLPPIVALAVADIVRARRAGDAARARATLQATAAGLGLAALLFVPLLAYELGSGFEETRHVLDYLTGGASEPPIDPFVGVVITLFRVIGWALVGLVTDAAGAAIVTVSAVVVLAVWLVFAARGTERLAVRWLVLTVAWSAVALTLVAPSLQTVVEGLPNDHYHAYIDPIVFVLVGLTARALTVGSGPRHRVDVAARTVVAAGLAGLVILGLRLGPPQDPNGGWPAAERAGLRLATVAVDPIDIRQLPVFKTAEGVAFPVIRAGREVLVATDRAEALRPIQSGSTLVIACDRLFEDVMLADCGGPAEAAYLRQLLPGTPIPTRVERIDLSARVVVSIYRP